MLCTHYEHFKTPVTCNVVLPSHYMYQKRSHREGASPTFQKYIEDGLAEIERQRNSAVVSSDGGNVTHHTITPTSDSNVNNFSTDHWMEKLNIMLVNTRGAPSGTNYDGNSLLDNKAPDENLNVNQQFGDKSSVLSLLKKDHHPESLSSNRLELLQQKLAQIRQPE
ncbi:hypothetical protein DMENIID0001_029560 [Sergentomyia squamirostris]